MKEEVKLVYKAGCDEIVEKKSRFIAHVFPVSNEEEAAAYLEQIKRNTGMPDITATHTASGSSSPSFALRMTENRPGQQESLF